MFASLLELYMATAVTISVINYSSVVMNLILILGFKKLFFQV
jgi:hypothetical protein